MSKALSFLDNSGGNMWIKRFSTLINLELVQELVLDNEQILVFYDTGRIWRSIRFDSKEDAEKQFALIMQGLQEERHYVEVETYTELKRPSWPLPSD